MRELKQLEKQWNDAAKFRGIRANLTLGDDGLTLGANTILAKRNDDGTLALEGEEPKVLALLSVACGRPVDESVLGSIRSASKHAGAGDKSMAAMHIALARIPRISDPLDAARRLFIADGLIEAGVSPRDICNALEFDSTPLDRLEKYDPDQPRVPAGSGRPSGRWTGGGTATATAGSDALTAARAATEAVAARIPKIAQRLPGIALRLTELAAHLNLAFDVLDMTLQSSTTSGAESNGSVRGLPNLQYSQYQDEFGLRLVDRSTGRTVGTLTPTGVRGQYADRHSGIVAQMEGDELVLRSATNAVSQVQARKKEPQLCLEPKVPDYKGMIGPRGDRSREYEAIMRERTNPTDPTPPGMAYGLANPETGVLIKFDDCEHSTGDMMEYKGHGLADQLRYEPNRTSIGIDMVKEATSQILASEGRHLVWNFAELPTLEYARTLFQANPLLERIELRYEPWPEGARWRWSRAKNQWLRSIRRLGLWKHLMSAGHEYFSF